MTRPCPSHPDIRDATDRHCWRCEQDTARTDHAAGAAKVRAAIAAAPRPTRPADPAPDTTHARALARARKERTTR